MVQTNNQKGATDVILRCWAMGSVKLKSSE